MDEREFQIIMAVNDGITVVTTSVAKNIKTYHIQKYWNGNLNQFLFSLIVDIYGITKGIDKSVVPIGGQDGYAVSNRQ